MKENLTQEDIQAMDETQRCAWVLEHENYLYAAVNQIDLSKMPGYDKDDLYNLALFGFLKAFASYEDGKGACFKTYATTCASNELKQASRLFRAVKRRGDVEAVSFEALEETMHTGSGVSVERKVMLKYAVEELEKIAHSVLDDESFDILFSYYQGDTIPAIAKAQNKTKAYICEVIQVSSAVFRWTLTQLKIEDIGDIA